MPLKEDEIVTREAGESSLASRLEHIISELLIANGNLTRRLQAVSNLRRLTWSQVGIMSRLERTGPMTPADLARAEAVKPQSMSGTLANLEVEGLVERLPDPTDGRQVLFQLTEEGAKVRNAVRIARQDWLRAQIEKLSAGQLSVLEEAFPIIIGLADD